MSRWTQEDHLRNENETARYSDMIEQYLANTQYVEWFEEDQASMYDPTLARGIQETLMASHENMRERARRGLRQITALASEAREEAADALELHAQAEDLLEMGDTRVPGHTCPAIDKVQRILRQLVWRMDNPDRETRQTVRDLVVAGIAHLETVRAENKQMRQAHAEMQKKVTS